MKVHEFYLMFEFLLLFCQILILIVLVRCSGSRSTHVLYQRFNPICWLALFYGMWFILPQLLSLLTPGYPLSGFETYDARERIEFIFGGQVCMLAYLLPLCLGVFATLPWLPTESGQRIDLNRPTSTSGTTYVLICFVLGVSAMYVLGREHLASDEMRSQLVKSTKGKLLTVVMFFGNFAFAFLFSHLLIAKRHVVAVLVLVVFASGVFFTGARGRLLWPLAISVVFVSIYHNQFSTKRIVLVGCFVVCVLLFADPLLTAIRTNDPQMFVNRVFNFEHVATTITEKRDFDGFPNVVLMTQLDLAQRDISILYTGAREAFMGTYFPEVLEAGVAFGCPMPGMLWIAAGFPGLLLGGFTFGLALGIINLLLRRIRDERLLWSYLFAMTWFCAIGGEFQEALDKLLIAASPALIWWCASVTLRAFNTKSVASEISMRNTPLSTSAIQT